MAEIINPVVKQEEGTTYVFGPEDYLITEKHTIADILRFAMSQVGNDKEYLTAVLKTVEPIGEGE